MEWISVDCQGKCGPFGVQVTYAALDGTLPRLPLRVSHPVSSALSTGPPSPMTSSTTVPSVAGVLSGSLTVGVGPGSLATLRRTQLLRDPTVYTQIGCTPDQVRQSVRFIRLDRKTFKKISWIWITFPALVEPSWGSTGVYPRRKSNGSSHVAVLVIDNLAKLQLS